MIIRESYNTKKYLLSQADHIWQSRLYNAIPQLFIPHFVWE